MAWKDDLLSLVIEAASDPTFIDDAPLPHIFDEAFAELLSMVSNEQMLEDVAPGICSAGAFDVFAVAARHLSSLAVRRKDESLLTPALVAVDLAGFGKTSRCGNGDEYQFATGELRMPYRAAELIGRDPIELYDRVATIVGDPAATTFRRLTKLQRKETRIEWAGNFEGGDQDGFRFVHNHRDGKRHPWRTD